MRLEDRRVAGRRIRNDQCPAVAWEISIGMLCFVATLAAYATVAEYEQALSVVVENFYDLRPILFGRLLLSCCLRLPPFPVLSVLFTSGEVYLLMSAGCDQ